MQLFVDEYETEGGTEYFITYEDPARIAVYGFLRLRIGETSEGITKLMPELEDCAFIRELHVYGTLVSVGERNELASQHKGVGKKLMKAAEDIVAKSALPKVAVISGVGVRGYYAKLGYEKIGTYMVKTIKSV